MPDDGSEAENEFYSSSIRVSVYDPISFGELAPLLDDLNRRILDVEARRMNLRPTMAGSLDIAIAILVVYAGVASIEFVKKFAGMLAEDAYQSIREKLHALRGRADEVADERTWGITIQVGVHPFHFEGMVEDRDFVARLRAAQLIIESSPDALLATSELPHEMEPGWYWRGDHWEPTPALAERIRRTGETP